MFTNLLPNTNLYIVVTSQAGTAIEDCPPVVNYITSAQAVG